MAIELEKSPLESLQTIFLFLFGSLGTSSSVLCATVDAKIKFPFAADPAVSDDAAALVQCLRGR